MSYRIFGNDFNIKLGSNQLKVHHIFARDQLSIDRCFSNYFKDFKAIVKGKSCAYDENVLLGKTELMADRGDSQTVALREVKLELSRGSL